MEISTWNVIDLARDFIQYHTVTPEDNGLQSRLITYLEKIGFSIYSLPFEEVHNFYARMGKSSPVFCFVGHTDVVPPGPVEEWIFPPFEGKLDDGLLYGRGSADMKGAIAAMLSATHDLLKNSSLKNGSIAFLITGDEEGPAVNGTAKMMEWIRGKGEEIDYYLVGEPTSLAKIGDKVKNGRRGSINGYLTLFGIQGHVAYPHLAKNPLHDCLDILNQLVHLHFDSGNRFFEPTHLTLTNIQGGYGKDNMIPDRVEIRFNIRYGTSSNLHSIQKKIENLLHESGKKFSLHLRDSGKAFLSKKGKLIQAIFESVREETGIKPELSTGGGTSDARFIASEEVEIAELGLKSETIHKINEHVRIDDLLSLSKIYKKIMEKLFLN